MKQLTQRYGRHWEKAIKQLKYLKTSKEHTRKEVSMSLDLFKLHLPQAKALCKKLRRQGSSLAVERVAKDAPDFVFQIDSPILANASNVPDNLDSNPTTSAVTLYRLADDSRNISPRTLRGA